MNELVSKSEKMISTRELAEVLNVSNMAIKRVLDKTNNLNCTVKVENGKTTYFNEEQATLIKQEIQKHHNLKSRQIDVVSTEVEENETILKAIHILRNRNEELKKRAEIAENKNALLMHSEKSYTISEIAKELGCKSAIEFNRILNRDKILFKRNNTWIPYADYSEQGYFEIKQTILEDETVVYNLRVTQKGREFLLSNYSDKNKLF
jgi:phage antirepressor YoqD-like protein